MNPLLLLILILVFASERNSGKNRNPYIKNASFPKGKKMKALHINPSAFSGRPPVTYFDTFKMELLLDRLHAITEALEKINQLNRMRDLPVNGENSINRIQESLDAAKGFIADSKAQQKVDTLSHTISGMKGLGDMSAILKNMGPLLSMLGAGSEDPS